MSKDSSKVSRSPWGQMGPTKKSKIIEHFRQCWQFYQIQEGLLAPQGGSKPISYTSSCLKSMLLLWHTQLNVYDLAYFDLTKMGKKMKSTIFSALIWATF